MRFIS